MTIADLMMPELTREADMTRKLLARVPADKLGFSPGAGLHTIGWNASHLAEIVGWVPGIIADPGMDLAKLDAEQVTPPTDDTEELLSRFDANLQTSLAALKGVSDDTMLNGTWTMWMNGQELFTMKKGDCLRKWVFVHTGHHRGILAMSLRLAGVKLGSIYEE